MNFGDIIKPELLLPLEETCDKFQINTILRCSHFISQVAHESADFKFKEENLNYSSIGLAKTWKKRFAKQDIKGNLFEPLQPNELAFSIAKQPIKIANVVYANRLGNGSEESGDGWKYRGRGFIQLTGKNNYNEFSKFVGKDFVINPDLLLQDNYAMLSAGWFWNRSKLNIVADLGIDEDIIKKITKIINGGYIGVDDRILRFNNIYKKLKALNG